MVLFETFELIYQSIIVPIDIILSRFDNFFLFGILPYVAVIILIIGSLHRYRQHQFTHSSQSTQFLGNQQELRLGSMFFHYGIVIILLLHVIMFFVGYFALDLWNSLWQDESFATIIRALEVVGWSLAIMALVGLALLIYRHVANPRIRTVTTKMDWLVLASLVLQVTLGLWIAVIHFSGGHWYVNVIVPWLTSLLVLQPDVSMFGLPSFTTEVKIHVLNGMFLIAIFPFTRLIHLVSYPITYLSRPYQVVIWNIKKIRGQKRLRQSRDL